MVTISPLCQGGVPEGGNGYFRPIAYSLPLHNIERQEAYYMEDNCVFCQIIAGKVDADIVYKDEWVVAFRDRNPHAPIHLLIVPIKHIRSINDLTEDDEGTVSAMIATARHLADKFSIKRSGYKLVFNVEKGGGQVIFHLHMHLLGGW